MSGSDLSHDDPVFDAIDTGLVLLDGDHRVVSWNAWMEAASGIPARTARGQHLEDLFAGGLPPRVSTAIDDAIELGASSLITHSLHPKMFPLRTRAGKQLIHNVSIRSIGRRPTLRCLLQFFDVTVSAGRERILRERQDARYDAVVGSAPDAILTLDLQGTILTANPAAARQFGYSAQELVGQPMGMLLGDTTEWDKFFHGIVEGGSRPIELTARRQNGSATYVEASASTWKSEERVLVTAILRDVNERRMAVDALRLLNQTLEKRVAHSTADRNRMWKLSTDVMMVAGLEGTIYSVNPAWTQLLGWSETELVNAHFLEFVAADDRSIVQSELQALARGDAPRRIEAGMRMRDGKTRRIEWSAVAADGFLQAVGRDVTDVHEAQAALRNAEEALRHSQKMEAIGQLTGGIAHDFNNMLTAIIGSLDILKRRIRNGRYEDIQTFMDGAISAANRAAVLTHRLLSFARRQPLDPKPVDVNQLIRDMEELLTTTLGDAISLKLDLSADMLPALTDENQLENAILNLAINARDAMTRGGVLSITTERKLLEDVARFGQEEIAPGDYVIVRVNDSGVGMAADVLDKVFEPFFTTKPIGQGTGLGLSMIYGFAKQSRGHITVESAVGKGTTFTLYLPTYQGVLRTRPTRRTSEAAAGAGEMVLVIEDDASVRLIISDVLRELGYACIEAADGYAAMPMLTSNTHLDLLITDVGLPGLNGRQIAEIARQHRPDLKILLVTGYDEGAASHGPFLQPGMELVTKPFALDALALKISEMVRR